MDKCKFPHLEPNGVVLINAVFIGDKTIELRLESNIVGFPFDSKVNREYITSIEDENDHERALQIGEICMNPVRGKLIP